MKEIANLARIATSRSLPSTPILEVQTRNGNKEAQLVSALLATPEASQLQLVKTLYGRNDARNSRALQRLQLRVQHKLLNQLYFLDNSDSRFVVSRRYELECFALLHKGRILYAEGEYVLSERLLIRALRLAREGDFTQYALQCARLLRTLYTEKRQRARYKKISKQLTKWQQVLTWEDEAERIYSDTQLALGQAVKVRRNLLAAIPGYLEQLDELNRKAKTYNTFYFRYRLQLAYEELKGDFTEIIRITNAAAKRLRDGRLNARRFDKRFNHFMSVYAHLRGRQAQQGMKLAENYSRDFHPSSSNWLYFQEHYFLLALHAEQYPRAQQIILTTRKNPTYLKQREAALERWELYRAYADFVLPPQRIPLVRRQLMAKWVLTLPEYSRDKRGHNVAILVLQLLHFLRARDLDEVLIRVERLRKYQQRHLRESSSLRSRLFLRLLFVIVDKNFDYVQSAERGKALLQQLRDTPPPGEAFGEVEIIPYEHLWALTLNILQKGVPITKIEPEAAPKK